VAKIRLVDGSYIVSYAIDESMFSTEGTLESLQEELEGLLRNYGKDTRYQVDTEHSTINLTLIGTRPATEGEIEEFKNIRIKRKNITSPKKEPRNKVKNG